MAAILPQVRQEFEYPHHIRVKKMQMCFMFSLNKPGLMGNIFLTSERKFVVATEITSRATEKLNSWI